ncbi:putative 3-demethylubiquinone-9 3-methyltransferase (glyoxalase superfamily) [Nakamurella sp. UYEF19]|uniref:VOC family protein n=1 Tax=Nakamurella sp. UYEF19 TaxID=1756392 RepID=UPI003392E067
MQITPCLWFDDNAEEAMAFYAGVFPDFEAIDVSRSGPENAVLTATFQMAGARFMALNGGPQFPFTEAISFFIPVETQQEVDDLWSALTADGGQESRCGWLKDRFGVAWQVVPTALGRLLGDPDREKAGRVLQAMMQMQKIDVPALEAAYRG